jgi:predicted alpha/beta hydrolase family esterase
MLEYGSEIEIKGDILWIVQLEKELSTLDGELILIGHSLGGSVLLKYLSEEDCHQSISGLYMIATPYWDKYGDWQNNEYTLHTTWRCLSK